MVRKNSSNNLLSNASLLYKRQRLSYKRQRLSSVLVMFPEDLLDTVVDAKD